MKWLVGLVVAAVLAVSGCTRGGLQSGEGRLVFDKASVALSRDGGPYRPVDDDVSLSRGDRVRLSAGEATLRLPDNGRMLLRAGSNVRLESQPVLLRGDVIAIPGRKPITVRALESRVVAHSGVVRVRSGFGVTAAVYDGLARLTTAGRTLSVPALRQASITAYGLLPDRPSPLNYNQDDPDPWDLRYLATAIELSVDLQDRSEGFTTQLREGQGRTLGFYRLLLPRLEREQGVAACLSDRVSDQGGPQGETLVGASIALEASGGTFLERCRATFAFREEGATWGLVALDQGLTRLSAIRKVLSDAVGRLPVSATFAAPPLSAPIEAAAPVAPVAETPPPAETPRAGTATGPDGGTAAPAGQEPPAEGLLPAVPAVPGLPPVETPRDPDTGLLEPLLNPVESVVGGLLGALLR
jgi:hypothetical protein